MRRRTVARTTVRTVVVVCAAIGGSWAVAASASALELGPVSVPVPVTLPTVGPVSVEAPSVAPDLGVNATVSPATGVSVDVKTPSAVGPIQLPTGASQTVHVAIGADAARIAVTPSTGAPVPTPGSPAVANRVPVASVSPSAVPARTAGQNTDGTSATIAGVPVHRVVPPQEAVRDGLPVDNTAGVVNASLRHQTHRGWDLWREVARARLLWIALLLIALVAQWVAGGFIRDALHRARAANPA